MANQITNVYVDESDIKAYVNIPAGIFTHCGKNSVIFVADGGNHFNHYGIYEGMFLFFDTEKPFKKGRLSCFKSENDNLPKYKVSDKPMPGYLHLGRLVYALKNYEEE